MVIPEVHRIQTMFRHFWQVAGAHWEQPADHQLIIEVWRAFCCVARLRMMCLKVGCTLKTQKALKNTLASARPGSRWILQMQMVFKSGLIYVDRIRGLFLVSRLGLGGEPFLASRLGEIRGILERIRTCFVLSGLATQDLKRYLPREMRWVKQVGATCHQILPWHQSPSEHPQAPRLSQTYVPRLLIC